MKKIAVIASGWHHPLSFYSMIAKQVLPDGWSMDLFCVSHRDPSFTMEEKKDKKFTGERGYLDERLYTGIASKQDIESLGWKYIEKPNTIGDWGNSNQWLEDHNYKDYDLFLFTHDDNLILSDRWFKAIIEDESFLEWEILCNSAGAPEGWVRGSCEFFKPSFIEKIGGKFDLSMVTLNREGETKGSEDIMQLYDWNSTVEPLMKFVKDNNIVVGYCSPSYRISAYCIEGERGYISNTQSGNKRREDDGLAVLKAAQII